jgi:hypothetical protein
MQSQARELTQTLGPRTAWSTPYRSASATGNRTSYKHKGWCSTQEWFLRRVSPGGRTSNDAWMASRRLQPTDVPEGSWGAALVIDASFEVRAGGALGALDTSRYGVPD